MQRLDDTTSFLEWLPASGDGSGSVTGYDVEGWPDSTWVLHAMYENASLNGLGSHDDIHHQRLSARTIAPTIIGDVNLDEGTTVIGATLGFVPRPGEPWVRITWREFLARFPDFEPNRSVPPCFRWFPPGSLPFAVQPPTEGSLDEETLQTLLRVLDSHEPHLPGDDVFAYYASLPAGDFDEVHLWRGSLDQIPSLIVENGGQYVSSPTNFWPADRSWFVWTDWDLSATRVSGSPGLIAAIRSDLSLETVDWRSH